MKAQFTILLSALIALSQANAQSGTLVSGYVKDNNAKSLSAVNVSLLKAKDSSLLKSEISDASGHFEIIAKNPGNYLLSYTNIGFQTTYSQQFEIKPGHPVEMETVQLKPAIKTLEGVTVVSKKPMIEIKADKTVFNVENSINATGSNALELLQKSPGVQVDNNDNISMRGKNGTKIYIDGKMLQLDAKNLAEYLKSINSNDIESIEMITNPSAKYDASGNAGIINIKLKKNKKFGTNGSANAGLVQGITPKGNAGLNLNYRDKKINIFSNINGNLGRYENPLDLHRLQKDTIYDQHGINASNNKSINGKVGADLFINSKNTIGVMANINYSDQQWGASNYTDIYYNPTGDFVKKLVASNNVPGTRTNANYNVNYRYADTSGKEINFDADYGTFRGTGSSYQPNNYYDANGNLLYAIINKNNTPINIDIYTAKLDAEQKAWKGKLGYGGKFSYVTTNNTFDFFNVINGNTIKVLGKSNSFWYKENVNAAYVNYQRQFNTKWSVQTGVRMEQTNSHGILIRADGVRQSDDDVQRSYLDFFPSAALSWNVNKNNTFNLTYSRRIDRPTYQDLNPFENKLDELTYEKGNAFLKPQYTDNIELTHILKSMISTSVGYSHVRDYATQITDTAGNATYVQQQNLATQQIISVNISSPLPIKKWWNGYVNVWYNYQLFNGEYGNKQVSTTLPTYGAYMQQTFNLGKDYSAEVSGWFNGPGLWAATWQTSSQGSLDIGFQKLLMKKKATLKISATDIFHTAPWSAHSNFGGLVLNAHGGWESQTLRVNFTYRFGSNQIKSARQRQTGLESESKRIKG
jgi:iron complex outermembrane receptor protein